MPQQGPYGVIDLVVPAAQNWVNSGLYVYPGDEVRITASGEWRVKNVPLHGPNSHSDKSHRDCAFGTLAARIGLYYNEALFCIGETGQFTADREGIVYLGGVAGSDLGETYESRKHAQGALQVRIESEGATVPTVLADEVPFYPFEAVDSGWVEILGTHTILTLPTLTVIEDRATLSDAIARFDALYTTHRSLRGKAPYHGQPVRWFPDTEDAPGWMLAGNPVRMDPALVEGGDGTRISRAAESGNNNWGIAHELGHNFNFAGGHWAYTNAVGLEAWPNIFSLHALETLGLPPRELDCESRYAEYQSSGDYENTLKKDPWLGICFLMAFQQRWGWDFYRRFYQALDAQPGSGNRYMYERFSEAAGEDVRAIFDAWAIPIE